MRKLLFFFILLTLCQLAFGQFRNRKDRAKQRSGLNYSNPQEYEVAGIDITGLKVLDKNALISLTGLRVGDKVKVPGDEISGAIKKLWKHGLVGDVEIKADKIEGDKIYLVIQLSERPRLTGFSFEGVKKGKETELKEDLNLIRGRILTDAIVRNTEITVKNFYVSKGFLNADVKVIQEADTVNRDGVRLRIKVDRGPKVKIHRVTFEGNENFDDKKLKGKMKSTNEYPRFSLFKRAFETIFGITPKSLGEFMTTSKDISNDQFRQFLNDNVKLNFFKSSKFVSADYEEDKKALIAFYNANGYRDATIMSDTIINYDRRSIDVRLKMDEGRKYYFRNIDWTGNYVHTDETLNKILDIEDGDVYNRELIDQKLSFNPKGTDISGLYMDDGYLFFQVTPVEVAVEGDSIDIEMRVFEGDQATINKVIITGNERTSDHVIRRELRTIPGQKFRRSDIIRSQQTLASLGYFNPETINPMPLPNPADGTVDIEWAVEEQSSDQIELSGGWGGAFGFVGSVGLVLNNFSLRNMMKLKFTPVPVGDGQRLSLRLQANGRQFQSYSFSFTEPWLGGKKPNSLSVSFNFSRQRARTNPETPFNDFDASLRLRGVTVGLGRRLEWPDNYFTLSNSVSYLIYELDNWGNQGLGFSDGNATSITFNTTLSRNSIDNPMYPTFGSSVSLNVSLTPPYSVWRDIDYETAENAELYRWVEYHKWMFDAKYYLTVVGKLVLETKLHMGFIGSYTNKAGVGPFERFILGGDGLAGQNFIIGNEIIGLRGYENNTINPPNYRQPTTEVTQGVIEGGVVYNKYGMELRYPVTTGQAATIYGFVFGEAGNNWNNFQEFDPFNSFRSAGFGARIFMPAFGLIGLNWAYGFDKLPGSPQISGSQFHFTIGQQIR